MKKILLLSLLSFTQMSKPISSEVTCKAGMAGGVFGSIYCLANIYNLSAQKKNFVEQLKIDAMNKTQRERNIRLNQAGIKKLHALLPSIIAKPIAGCFYTNPLKYQAPALTRQDRMLLAKKIHALDNTISQHALALNGCLAIGGASFGKLIAIQNEQAEFNTICTTLGIDPHDSLEQAREKHRRLVLATAPDRTGDHSDASNERFRAINEAWNRYRAYRADHPDQFNQNTAPVPAPQQNQAPQDPDALD